MAIGVSPKKPFEEKRLFFAGNTKGGKGKLRVGLSKDLCNNWMRRLKKCFSGLGRPNLEVEALWFPVPISLKLQLCVQNMICSVGSGALNEL